MIGNLICLLVHNLFANLWRVVNGDAICRECGREWIRR
jgi:hypothetical protein